MSTFEILLILVACCVPLAVLADALRIPIAVTLVLGGMVLALVPGMPKVELQPELALALFLPPLLQLSAYRTDWGEFRNNLPPILLLAIGAVFFTAVAVAVAVKWVVPGLPWWGAVALGAIVAPPDAVAASAVLRKMPLPRRIVTVLEGESLINDASSLVLYRFAVAATLAGTASFGQGALAFVGGAVGGCLVGWIAGKLTMWIYAHVHGTLLDVMIGLLSGYIAYLAADRIHVSGVLATVVCGLFLGRYQRTQFTAQTRLESAAVWSFVEFFLTSLVFIMIGLQLRGIVGRIERFNGWDLALIAACSTGALIASRFVWIFGTSWLRHRLSDSEDRRTPWAHFAVMSWSGMRGVVSLAAALALPGNFPQRDLVVFLAFCAILATLVLQGTTLRFFIRWLGVEDAGASAVHREITQLRSWIQSTERDAVREHAAGDSEHRAAAAELIDEFESRATRLESTRDNTDAQQLTHRAQLRLRLVALARARRQFDAQAGSLDPEARNTLMAELDLQETQIRSALGETGGEGMDDGFFDPEAEADVGAAANHPDAARPASETPDERASKRPAEAAVKSLDGRSRTLGSESRSSDQLNE